MFTETYTINNKNLHYKTSLKSLFYIKFLSTMLYNHNTYLYYTILNNIAIDKLLIMYKFIDSIFSKNNSE